MKRGFSLRGVLPYLIVSNIWAEIDVLAVDGR